jgi:lantibiotic modifying enzyme
MDRRAFTVKLSAIGLGLAGCGGPPDLVVSPQTPPVPPTQPPDAPTSFATPAERGFGVVAGLVKAAEAASGGVRWGVLNEGARSYPTDLYAGQAGVLAFLAEAHRIRPDDHLRGVIEQGGAWLQAQPRQASNSLFEGNAGRAWAFLSLHELFGATSSRWLDAALELAPGVASSRSGLPCDLINGPAGQGLFLLRLHSVTGDLRWLSAARDIGTFMLGHGVRSGGGTKFPSAKLSTGETMFYPGLAHGTAGAGFYLARLAQALPVGERQAFADGAEAAATWLDGLARRAGTGVNWYRREPDQTSQEQAQWCHGAPGIGLFYAELYRLTKDPRHLAMAEGCAATVDGAGRAHGLACQCHGVAGNAELYFKLFRETGEPMWLEKARSFSDVVWARRIRSAEHPAWPSGDGNNVDNPGLMTGTAGVGWFYLQLAVEGTLHGPVTD